jgi:hypothetical protein
VLVLVLELLEPPPQAARKSPAADTATHNSFLPTRFISRSQGRLSNSAQALRHLPTREP